MENTFWTALGASSLAAIVTTIGIYVIRRFESWGSENDIYFTRIDESLLGALLVFSAGALIYVGATHLLPQAETGHKRYSLLALGAGILVALVIVLSKA